MEHYSIQIGRFFLLHIEIHKSTVIGIVVIPDVLVAFVLNLLRVSAVGRSGIHPSQSSLKIKILPFLNLFSRSLRYIHYSTGGRTLQSWVYFPHSSMRILQSAAACPIQTQMQSAIIEINN